MTNSRRSPTDYVFPIPLGTSLDDREDIRSVAETAYIWGWALANVANRADQMSQFADKESLLVNGWPIGYNAFTLQTEPANPKQRLMCCPNTSLRYGGGAFTLGTKGVVAQVPQELVDSGEFWLYSLYDARSGQFGAIGKQHGSGSRFYLIVGPRWDGTNPDPGEFPRERIIHCPTELAFLTARIFIDPDEDNPDWLDSVNFYLADDYVAGAWQNVDWDDVRDIPCPVIRDEERTYVHPSTFFDQLGDLLDSVPLQAGEERLYDSFRRLLVLANNDRRVMRQCRAVARETERNTINRYMLWRNNGDDAGNGWYTTLHSGNWPITEYAARTATAKSNLFQNRREDTHYYCTDTTTGGAWLHGRNTYKLTFEGGLPPAQGPWSVTVYRHNHFLYQEPYSFSNRDLSGLSGTLVVYAGPEPPLAGCNFIRTPRGEKFCLYFRAYWMDPSLLPWTPPRVEKVTVV